MRERWIAGKPLCSSSPVHEPPDLRTAGRRLVGLGEPLGCLALQAHHFRGPAGGAPGVITAETSTFGSRTTLTARVGRRVPRLRAAGLAHR